MATLQVTNLQNSASGVVNLSLNSDGTSTITLFTSASAPTGFRTGTLWYDVTGAGLKVYNGTTWSDVGGGSVVGSFSAGTTGFTPVSATTGAVTLAGTLAVSHGGTGSTTVVDARTSLLPAQTGQNGKVLGTNGTDVSWVTVSGTGTVTSVNVLGGTTGLTPTGGPITAAGDITLGGTLAVAHGGTGGVTPTAALTNLLPSQTGNSGKFLRTDGTTTSWVAEAGSGTVTSVNVVGGTTGLTTTGGPITAAGDITINGTLAVAHGGTGGVTPTAALTNLLPSQTGNSGKFLRTDGTTTSWVAEAGSGTVTSVNVVGGTTGLTSTGGPITAAGDLTLGGTLAIAHGGTGAVTAAAARTGLLPSQTGESGKVLGTNGTDVSWVADGKGVEEVAAAPTGNLTVTGGTGPTATISTVANPTFTGLVTGRQLTLTGPAQPAVGSTLIVEGGGIESRPGGSNTDPGFKLSESSGGPFFGGLFLNVTNRQMGMTTEDGEIGRFSPTANEFAAKVLVTNGGSATTPAFAAGGVGSGMYRATETGFVNNVVGLSVDGQATLLVGETSGFGSGERAIQVNNCATSSSGGTPIHANGSNIFFKFSSSIRTKQNVIEVPEAWGLEFVRDTRSVQYEPNRGETVEGQDGPPKCFGYIAEELAEKYPELVVWEDGVISGVRYMHFHGIHHKAIKELDAKVSGLEAENAALVSTIADLIARVEALENA